MIFKGQKSLNFIILIFYGIDILFDISHLSHILFWLNLIIFKVKLKNIEDNVNLNPSFII